MPSLCDARLAFRQSNFRMLKIDNLNVFYGKRKAVDDLNLTVEKGQIVGLLGPNGAGKSTALLASAGALIPSSGAVSVNDISLESDPIAFKKSVGFADQPPSLYEYFTVLEHVLFVAEARGEASEQQALEVLEKLGLLSIKDRLCRECSFGMRQRIGLAAALVGKIEMILLDETLNGLDPHASVMAREAIKEAASQGAKVLMSTHLLGVSERLCNRIVIMNEGRVVKDLQESELQNLLSQGDGAIESLYLSLIPREPT